MESAYGDHCYFTQRQMNILGVISIMVIFIITVITARRLMQTAFPRHHYEEQSPYAEYDSSNLQNTSCL